MYTTYFSGGGCGGRCHTAVSISRLLLLFDQGSGLELINILLVPELELSVP